MPIALDLHDDESYPTYIRAIFGEVVAWKARGRCHGKARGGQKVWFLEDDHPGIGIEGTVGIHAKVTGDQLAKMALAECAICPVHWECFEFAVRGQQDFCIYATRATDRKWLRKHYPDTWEEITADARKRGESPQKMMVRVKLEYKARQRTAAIEAAKAS